MGLSGVKLSALTLCVTDFFVGGERLGRWQVGSLGI